MVEGKVMKKKCIKCSIEKELGEFYASSLRTHTYICRECCKCRRINKTRQTLTFEGMEIKCYVCDEKKRSNEFQLCDLRNYNYLCKKCRKKKLTKWRLQATNEDLSLFDRDCRNQSSLCVICHKQEVLVYDHDHKTGKYRGAICHACNQLIGFAYDNPTTLRSAATYLEAFSSIPLPVFIDKASYAP